MAIEHFNRLGELVSVILSENDHIMSTGRITDSAPGARHLTIKRHNSSFQLYSHPSNTEVMVESVYRPSNVFDAAMNDTKVQNYAENVGISAQNETKLRQEVVSQRVIKLNRKVDVEEAYELIREAESPTAPYIAVLPVDEYSDDPDGFAVRDNLYPGQDNFSIATYKQTVDGMLDTWVELAEELNQTLGLNDFSDNPTEQEPDEPSSGMGNHAFH